MSNFNNNPVLTNCTFAGNSASAISISHFSTLTVTSCIFWGNTEGAISAIDSVTVIVTYSDVQGGWDGIGNIDTDPLFVDVTVDDYRLLPASPCIDAGDPDYVAIPNETDLDGSPRVVNGRIDMGAYERSSSISLEVGISPDTINLKSQGKYITALLTFSEGCNVADVDVATILLQEQIQPLDWVWYDEEENLLMVRFDREDVQAVLSVGNNVDVKITGSFFDGTPFEGTGVVKVINQGGGKKPK